MSGDVDPLIRGVAGLLLYLGGHFVTRPLVVEA